MVNHIYDRFWLYKTVSIWTVLAVLLGVVLQSFDGLDDHLGDRRELLLGRGLLLGSLVVDFLLLLALALLFLLRVRVVLDVVLPLLLRALPAALRGGAGRSKNGK